LKVFERVLKLCVGRGIRVSYGKGKLLEGILLNFDNLCLVIGILNERDRSLRKVVIIKKSQLESIEVLDNRTVMSIYKEIFQL